LTPDASPADLIPIDQQGHAYSTYLVEAGQMKVFFVIQPDGPVIGAIIHGAEGMQKYFSRIWMCSGQFLYTLINVVGYHS
jgi:hypothetical protein